MIEIKKYNFIKNVFKNKLNFYEDVKALSLQLIMQL